MKKCANFGLGLRPGQFLDSTLHGPLAPALLDSDGTFAMYAIWIALFAACLALPGCASLGRPDWTAPGPAAKQRRRAVRFDPYLQDDIAPASLRLSIMDGARPRDFADPVPEVNRSRWWAPVR